MPKKKYTKKQKGGMESSRRSRSRTEVDHVLEVDQGLEVEHVLEVGLEP